MGKLIEWAGSTVLVQTVPNIRIEIVEAVIDLDENENVIGIEILGTANKYPDLVSVEATPASPRIAVDHDADAIYVNLGHGTSIRQPLKMAGLFFDGANRIVGISVDMAEFQSSEAPRTY